MQKGLGGSVVVAFGRCSMGRTFLALLFALAATAAVAQNADRIVATRGEAVVFESDLREAFLVIPEDLRSGVVANPDKVGAILDEILLAQQLVRGSEAGRRWIESLDFRPNVAEFKRKATEIMDAHAAVESEEGLDQLAREYFLADPRQFKLPDTVEFSLARWRSPALGLLDATSGSGEPAELLVEDANKAPVDLFELSAVETAGKSGEAAPNPLVETLDRDALSKLPTVAVMAARSLREVGDSSSVFQLDEGVYAQMRLDKFEPGRQQGFDEVKGAIIQRLRVDLKQAAVRRHTVPLGQLPLDINGEALNAVARAFLDASGKEG